MSARPRRAVFLDRDGTINAETPGFLTRVAQLRLLPGSADAIAALNRAGYHVVVLTNQSALARGLLTERGLERIHTTLIERLRKKHAHVDALFFCPHHPDGKVERYAKTCDCRKPAQGLLERATRVLDLTLDGSFVIGDDARDVALAQGNALTPILVCTGKGREKESEARAQLGKRLRVVDDLSAAVDLVLRRRAGR
ncbi:MAG: HAD-IIIA family hydrolase [Planctomycetes bacterium]|nr:HAD-IIIA family hydrolase [Planctomycetota bacterium]MCC7172850.1 HAD-IIIA family hydrolase [Planctomycetota bacterium]